jgi:DNA-binding beta-propeller fold protein YncE
VLSKLALALLVAGPLTAGGGQRVSSGSVVVAAPGSDSVAASGSDSIAASGSDSVAASGRRGIAASGPDSVAASAPDSVTAADTLSFRLVPLSGFRLAPGAPGVAIQPAGIATDHFGRIYVSDAAQHRLLRFDAGGSRLGESGTLGSGEGQMRRPGAVAPLGTLNIAVLDRENRRVLSYDLFGRLQGTLIDLEAPPLDDQLGRVTPVDLAADRGGAVYVADVERDRVLAFDFSGRYVRTLGGLGARPGSFRGIAGLATGRRGEVVTAERVNARVQRLDPNGRVLAAWPIAARPTAGALAVAVDDSGRVAVADEVSGTLVVFDSGGRRLAELARLAGPRAITFTRGGTLLVAEAAAGRVRAFALEPNPEGRAGPGE